MGQKKFFPFFDTGASYFIISRATYNYLKNKKLIGDGGIISKETIEIADGSTIEAPIVIIKEIKLDCITLYNVKTAITEEGLPLFGQSVLNKFRAYTINNNKKTVTFYK